MSPQRILAFRDHLSFVGRFLGPDGAQPGFPEVARRLQAFQDSFCAAHGIRLHGELADGAAEGISHVLMADRYALPGQVVLGTDAHASHSGALGALAFGVDAADIANAWVNGRRAHHRSAHLPGAPARQAAARRVRQGPGAAPADPAGLA